MHISLYIICFLENKLIALIRLWYVLTCKRLGCVDDYPLGNQRTEISGGLNISEKLGRDMFVIGSLSMVCHGDGCGVLEGVGGRWEGVARALRGRCKGIWERWNLEGCWEGVGRWRVVRVGAGIGSLFDGQIKSLHCSGYRSSSNSILSLKSIKV